MNFIPEGAGQVAPDRNNKIPFILAQVVVREVGTDSVHNNTIFCCKFAELYKSHARAVDSRHLAAQGRQEHSISTFSFGQAKDLGAPKKEVSIV